MGDPDGLVPGRGAIGANRDPRLVDRRGAIRQTRERVEHAKVDIVRATVDAACVHDVDVLVRRAGRRPPHVNNVDVAEIVHGRRAVEAIAAVARVLRHRDRHDRPVGARVVAERRELGRTQRAARGAEAAVGENDDVARVDGIDRDVDFGLTEGRLADVDVDAGRDRGGAREDGIDRQQHARLERLQEQLAGIGQALRSARAPEERNRGSVAMSLFGEEERGQAHRDITSICARRPPAQQTESRTSMSRIAPSLRGPPPCTAK